MRAIGAAFKAGGDRAQCQGGDLYSCFRETPRDDAVYRRENLRVAAYLVVPERWGNLPVEMRPEAVRPRAAEKLHRWMQRARIGGPPEWVLEASDEWLVI